MSDNKVYVNNTEIYSFKDTMYNNDFVFVQDNYIFTIIDNKIIKIDPIQHSIVEEKEQDKSMKSFWLLSSVREGGARTLGIKKDWLRFQCIHYLSITEMYIHLMQQHFHSK